jgi:Zn-dependent protease with chaperone function
MEIWLILLIIFLIIHLLRAEWKSQGCWQKVCGNTTEKASSEDSIKRNIDLSIETLRRNSIPVGWRRAMLIGLILALPVCWIVLHRMPSGWEFFVTMMILFFVCNIISMWISYSWWNRRNILIEKEYLHLRQMS